VNGSRDLEGVHGTKHVQFDLDWARLQLSCWTMLPRSSQMRSTGTHYYFVLLGAAKNIDG